ncbi:MAG: VOC family protein [Dehalococcoidia bacterium]
MTNEGPVFNQVNLVVKNMEATVAFYRRLGLSIPDAAPGWEGHHRSVEMPDDGLELEFDSEAFAQKWNAGWSSAVNGGAGVLGFRVASREAVDELYAELTDAGYRNQQAPYDTFWGARYAIVEDPDGNAVGLMSPIDPARRSAPPPP